MVKRHSRPNAPADDGRRLLAQIVAGLVTDDPRAHYTAITALLSHGPFFASRVVLRCIERRPSPDEIAELRALLLDLVRGLVTWHGEGVMSGASHTTGSLQFSGVVGAPPAGQYMVDGTVRDVLVLQWTVLVTRAGFPEVRTCSAPDCERLYVQVFRRAFCSVRCQSRTYMRDRRKAITPARAGLARAGVTRSGWTGATPSPKTTPRNKGARTK